MEDAKRFLMPISVYDTLCYSCEELSSLFASRAVDGSTSNLVDVFHAKFRNSLYTLLHLLILATEDDFEASENESFFNEPVYLRTQAYLTEDVKSALWGHDLLARLLDERKQQQERQDPVEVEDVYRS
jgi:hypothetical protein